MSASSTSSATQDVSKTVTKIEDDELQIVMGEDVPNALNRNVVVKEGLCPVDRPHWPLPTLSTYDRRYLRPLSFRFLASNRGDLGSWLGRQDQIRQEIWRSIAQLQQEWHLDDPLPVIVFDCDTLDATKRYGCLEMTFETENLFICVGDKMSSITIRASGEEQCTKLDICQWSNTLESNIMPFDILRLPLTANNSSAVFKSVKSMMASLGTVVGLAAIEITSTTDGMAHPRTDTARFYLQLTPASMKMSWPSLIAAIPTHFVWESIPRTLQYSGRQLHQVAKHSDDYPVQEETNNATDSASSATPQTSSSAASSSGSSRSVKVEGSNDSNKRKRK